MAWNGDNGEWAPASSRRNRSSYVPWHLRPTELTDTSNVGSCRPVRGGASRGRGRGQWAEEPVRKQMDDLVDVSEKFDDLEVIEDGTVNSEGSGINFDAYEDIPVEFTGDDVPPPVNTFADIELGDALDRNIGRCKYVKPTPIQRHAIPIVVAGRDLMACAQTGSGKTAAFCFPIISLILKNRSSQRGSGRDCNVAYPSALIVSPTRELSCQIHDEAKKFAHQTGVKIIVAYGGAPISQQFRNLERGVDILVATPGRLVDLIERTKVSLSMIKYLALDEADRMLDMGFEPQIRKIVQQTDMPPPGKRQTMLFSATFPDEIQRLASDFLFNYVFLTVGRVGSSTELIAQRVNYVQDMDKRSHLLNLLHSERTNEIHGKHMLTLIFVETKKGADALEQWLSSRGFPTIAIHGDKIQMERERALRSFKSGRTPIMVATDVASRGLDIPHVAHVINFDFPKDIDDYVHRIGRTGRAGKSGIATAFFSDKNLPLAKSLVDLMKESNQEIPPWLSEHAETPYSAAAGRSKFGGYDYRSRSQYSSESNAASDNALCYGNSTGDDYNSGPCAYQYSTAPVNDPGSYPYAPGSRDYVFGNESIVASGWE